MFDLIFYVPSTIFQLNRDGSSWVEPVLSYDKCVLLKDHKAVRLQPAPPQSRVKHSTTFVETTYFSTDKVQCYFQVLKTQLLCPLLIHVLFKRMVKHKSSKYGWHIYNRCFHDECRKQGKYKLLDVVCFDQQKLKCKLHVFCLAPKITGQPIQYFCFALPKKFLTAFFVQYLIIHCLIFLLE